MNANRFDIIIRPIVTEKSNQMMEHGKYTFEVHPDANKIEIKKAVEQIFKVKVVKVNTISMKAKPKRLGKFSGYERSWKKAIVTLGPGQKIAFFEGVSA